MARVPYTLTAINDIALSGQVQNIFSDQQGRTLPQASMVLIALNGESVDVTAGVNIGGEQVLEAGSRVTLQATVGDLPIIPDDQLVVTFGNAGQEIIVSGRNVDAAASRELRAIIRVFPTDDFVLARVMEELRAVGAGLSR